MAACESTCKHTIVDNFSVIRCQTGNQSSWRRARETTTETDVSTSWLVSQRRWQHTTSCYSSQGWCWWTRNLDTKTLFRGKSSWKGSQQNKLGTHSTKIQNKFGSVARMHRKSSCEWPVSQEYRVK